MRIASLRYSVPAILVLALLSAPAEAGFITTSMDGSTPVMTFTIPGGGLNHEEGYVGPSTISYNGSASVQAYCTDIFKSIGVQDGYAATAQPLSALAGGDLVAKLFSADAALGGSNAVTKAALQLAIWDVVESARAATTPLDPLTAGTLTSTEYKIAGVVDITSTGLDLITVMGRVSSLLNLAPTLHSTALTYIEPSTSYGQGFVTPQAVPEPSSVILIGIGAVGLVGLRSRRRLLERRPD
jgi:hypothetical protein